MKKVKLVGNAGISDMGLIPKFVKPNFLIVLSMMVVLWVYLWTCQLAKYVFCELKLEIENLM